MRRAVGSDAKAACRACSWAGSTTYSMPGVGIEVAGTAVSGFSFLALAAEVEGAGVLPVDNGVWGFSVFSLDLSLSFTLSASRSLGSSGREADWVVEGVEFDMEVGLEWEADVLVWAGLDAVRDDEEGGLLGCPDVGRLGEGTLAPGMFRRFEGFGGVKAGINSDRNKNTGINREYGHTIICVARWFTFSKYK